MAARATTDIALLGPPHNASAVVQLDTAGQRVLPILLTIEGQARMHRAVVRPYGAGSSEIRLRLPRETPPGTYRGELSLAGKQLSTLVEIEPVLKLRINPKRTRLSVEPGTSAKFGVTVMNAGNIGFVVPESSTFDLDDAAGQDRALGRALRADLQPGERRVDRLFEDLREMHGGEARVSVRAGAGPLQPGESRELQCVLDVPVALRPARSYSGAWTLGHAGHVIEVTAARAAPAPAGRKNA